MRWRLLSSGVLLAASPGWRVTSRQSKKCTSLLLLRLGFWGAGGGCAVAAVVVESVLDIYGV